MLTHDNKSFHNFNDDELWDVIRNQDKNDRCELILRELDNLHLLLTEKQSVQIIKQINSLISIIEQAQENLNNKQTTIIESPDIHAEVRFSTSYNRIKNILNKNDNINLANVELELLRDLRIAKVKFALYQPNLNHQENHLNKENNQTLNTNYRKTFTAKSMDRYYVYGFKSHSSDDIFQFLLNAVVKAIKKIFSSQPKDDAKKEIQGRHSISVPILSQKSQLVPIVHIKEEEAHRVSNSI